MSEALLAGSAAAAFAAGLVAFFAPCCSGVMLPTYLAAVSGGSRWRVARSSGLYLAGVAAVVWPITLGASALAALVSRWHSQLFLAGGLLMIAVAVALWRGTMIPLPLPQPELTGSSLSVLGLGAFSGAATACCAPVLAGAAALSALNPSWWSGLALGGAYILGMTAPLLPVAALYTSAKKHLHDPAVTLHLGRYAKRTTVSRLAGAAIFAALGAAFVALALTGNADTTPAFQQGLGTLARRLAAQLEGIPNAVAWPALAAAVAVLVYLILKPKGERAT